MRYLPPLQLTCGCPAPQNAMNLSEEQHASLRDARRQLLTQTHTLRRQRAHLLQQLNTPLPGDSDVLNTEALSQVNCLPDSSPSSFVVPGAECYNDTRTRSSLAGSSIDALCMFSESHCGACTLHTHRDNIPSHRHMSSLSTPS